MTATITSGFTVRMIGNRRNSLMFDLKWRAYELIKNFDLTLPDLKQNLEQVVKSATSQVRNKERYRFTINDEGHLLAWMPGLNHPFLVIGENIPKGMYEHEKTESVKPPKKAKSSKDGNASLSMRERADLFLQEMLDQCEKSLQNLNPNTTYFAKFKNDIEHKKLMYGWLKQDIETRKEEVV